MLEIHQLLIDSGRRCVLVSGEPVELTATEFDLLNLLAGQPGVVFTGDRSSIVCTALILRRPTGPSTCNWRLAKETGSAGQYIDTVRGVGYRLKE